MTLASASTPTARWTRHAPAAVFAAALATAVPVWWMIAPPVLLLTAEGAQRHDAHLSWTFVHAALGTVMLVSGAVALWMGWTGRRGPLHHLAGRTYFLSGAVTSLVALVLNTVNVHRDSTLGAATSALAAAWLLTAAMAFRAIRHRRMESHKEWVVRSYVLTWSFVFCRGLGSLVPMDKAAADAALWLTWVGPLLICEVALQWSKGAPLRR